MPEWQQLQEFCTAMLTAALAAGATRHNVSALAAALLRTAAQIQDGAEQYSDEMRDRIELQRESLQAHQALNTITGTDHHSLGQATCAARQTLTRTERTTLQKLRRVANQARHQWAPEPQTYCAKPENKHLPRATDGAIAGRWRRSRKGKQRQRRARPTR